MADPVPRLTGNRLTREEGVARIRLIRSPNIGAVTFHHLLARFGSARAALDALPDLAARGQGAMRKAGKGPAPYAPVSAEAVEAEMLTVRGAGGRYVFHDSPDYPYLLGTLEAAPPILIVRGAMEMATRNPVAIVGARNASAGALRIARDLASGLAGRGSAVVSGLARGVDGAAHEGALSVSDGAGTVAVIAGGIDVTYPPEHAGLQERIAENALIISEMPPGTEPTNRHFPARNRIIAGLSMGTVVVEAALQSGSLITARLAGDYGREVMAVPGSPLDPRSHGCNQMIREGAILVQGVDDILELITSFQGLPRSHFREEAGGVPFAEGPLPEEIMPQETPQSVSDRIGVLLGVAPVGVGELIRQSGASTADVQAALIDMELAGIILRHAGGRVSRAVE